MITTTDEQFLIKRNGNSRFGDKERTFESTACEGRMGGLPRKEEKV
jgi:hypothetical protein